MLPRCLLTLGLVTTLGGRALPDEVLRNDARAMANGARELARESTFVNEMPWRAAILAAVRQSITPLS